MDRDLSLLQDWLGFRPDSWILFLFSPFGSALDCHFFSFWELETVSYVELVLYVFNFSSLDEEFIQFFDGMELMWLAFDWSNINIGAEVSGSSPHEEGTYVKTCGLEDLDLVFLGFFFGADAIVVMDNIGGQTLFL